MVVAVVTSDAAMTVGLSSISSETPMSASSSQLEHASNMEHVPGPSTERHAADEETGEREPAKHDEQANTPQALVAVHSAVEETHEVPVPRVLP